MQKRFIQVVAVGLLVGLFFGPVFGSKHADAKTQNIAYVITGTLGDKGFFDSGWAGLQKAKADYGVGRIKCIESFNPVDWEPNLRNAAQAGYDLIIAGGTPMRDYVAKLAPLFPKQHFVLFDGELSGIDNVISVEYGEEQGAYVAGVLAALMTTRTEVKGINPDKKVGFIGGMDIAVGRNWLQGFQQGVASVDPKIEVLYAFAGSFGDPAKGKELALAQYGQGADVILHAAGDTGLGVIEAAAEAGAFAIGSDSDQDSIKPGHVLTSVMKRVDKSLYDVATMHFKGPWRGGQNFMYNVVNDGVVLTEMSVIGDRVPKDIRAQVARTIQGIKDGSIKVVRNR
ncbi:MAG: BMP family lipoprotein [Bacteroidota bacterium]